jgi:molybdenum cofactor cytidylyltransferase
MTTAALILAAGESSRFAGFPKALLEAGTRTAVRRLSEVSLGQGFDPVVVVVGAHRMPIVHELKDLSVEVVEAERWYEGRTASVQAGVDALPTDRDILFWPVDHPFVSVRTVELLSSLLASDALGVWFIPTYEEHGGHPVVWRSTLRPDLLDLRPDAPIRSLLPEFGPQVRRVPVNDPGVVANIDTPEAYRTAHEIWLSRGED